MSRAVTFASAIGICVLAVQSPSAAGESTPHGIPTAVSDEYGAAIDDILTTFLHKCPHCSLSVTILDESTKSEVNSIEFDALRSSDEAYCLRVTNGAVTIKAFTPAGALFGLSELENQLLFEDAVSASCVTSPALDFRALHFILPRTSETEFREMIVHARRARMNALIVQIANAVAFESFPGRIRNDAMPVSTFRELVTLANQNGLTVIPELKLLTHQEKFLQDRHPDLMFNKATYDPNAQVVYEIVERHIDEIVDAIKPDYVHIGHDEVRGFGRASRERWLYPGEVPLPAGLYAQDVLKLHEMITGKGLKVMMWGDMLLRKGHLHEILQRSWKMRKDYPAVLYGLPRDILLVDWRYFDRGPDYPSVDAFVAAGFTTYGATWHDMEAMRAFSRHIASSKPGSRGMVATTWTTLRNEQYSKVYAIIRESGKAFWDGG